MKNHPVHHALGCLLSLLVLSSELSAETSEATQWLDDLKSQDYKTREVATDKLWSLGEEAIPLLEDARNSDDPEQSRRAWTITRNITLDLDASTPREVLKAIEAYQSALDVENKELIIRDLIENKAYKQIVLLLHQEPNPEHKAKLSGSQRIKRVAYHAAEQVLQQEGIAEAIKILSVAPRSERNLEALAFLMRRVGRLEGEIASLKKIGNLNVGQKTWLRILLQSQGDAAALREFAKQYKDARLTIALDVLDGDASSLLKLAKQSAQGVHLYGVDRMEKLWKEDRAGLRNDKDEINSDDGNLGHMQTRHQVEIHALLGDVGFVTSIIGQIDLIQLAYYRSAFPYRDTIWEELNIPNPHSERAAFLEWVTVTIAQTIGNDEVDQDEQQLVLLVMDTLVRTGDSDLVVELYTRYLDAVNESGDDHIYDVLKLMIGAGFAEEAYHYIATQIDDVDVMLPSIRRHLYGDDKNLDYVTERIERHHPELTEIEQLRLLMELMGNLQSSGQVVEAFLSKLEALGGQLGGQAQLDAIDALMFVGANRGDYQTRLRLVKMACGLQVPKEKKVKLINDYMQLSQVMLDPASVVDACELYQKELGELGQYKVLYAIAMCQLDPERGRPMLDEVITSTLGSLRIRARLAYRLHQAGMETEAHQMLEQLLVETSPLDKEFSFVVTAMIQLSSGIELEEPRGGWSRLAALRASQIVMLMDPEGETNTEAQLVRKHTEFCFSYGMALLKRGKKDFATDLLARSHKINLGHGSLADHFFPQVLQSSIRSTAEGWFAATWADMQQQISQHKGNHDALNSAAWLGARTARHLDVAESYSRKALELRMREPSYLDTLAEVFYAKGDARMAVKCSDESIDSLIHLGITGYSDHAAKTSHIELARQNQKFRSALKRASKE
ncbi:hypothetical protein [Rubritalea marina]|uniref:hypothetical protein n=1 Tax=Rubritalea marina TaxID=361055 RepID=UPI00037FB37F|nr:hypothetical protein [Rubritalea marina]